VGGRLAGVPATPHHPFRFGLQAKGPVDPHGWPETARRVEDLGWSTLTVADHVADALAPVPALMAAADATTTLRVGAMVLCNDLRHPVVTAKEAATIDLLSGGRFELGLGAGWQLEDYQLTGIAFDRPGVRISRLEEALVAIRALWGEGPATVHGDHYRITGLDGAPSPVQRPGPPVVVGGGGERVLRLAARHADVIALNVNLAAGVIDERAFPDGTPESTDRKLGWVADEAGDRYADLELQVRVHLAMVTDDRHGVIESMAPAFGLTAEQAADTPHALIGSVDEVCDQLVERRERWGISYIGLSGDQLEPFAPIVARLAGT
jgi:probable F420-dependent oxidoreductase